MTLIDGNAVYTWKYTDRFPNIPRAGHLIPLGDRDIAKTCFQEIPRPPTPKANDPDIASTIVHGFSVKASHSGGSWLNPPRKTLFKQRLHELSEAVYASSQKAPLGRSHDQSIGLPIWYDNKATNVVVKAIKGNHQGIDTGMIVNPPKTAEQVEEEAHEGHQAYIRSHGAYFVGERIDRKYNWSHYSKDSRFGVPTPHFNDGRCISKSLQWPCDTDKRYDDFREKTQKQCGKVNDPIANTLKVPPDHAFGIHMPPDKFGAGELVHATEPGHHQRGRERPCSLVNAVRRHLKKVNFQNFTSLLQAFRHYDKKGKGVIDKEDLQEVCRQFRLDLQGWVLEDLMDYCDLDKDGTINFLEFANFLNWKDRLPIGTLDQAIMTRERRSSTAPVNMHRTPPSGSQFRALIKQEDLEPVKPGSALKTPRTLSRPQIAPDHFSTSSSLIRAVVGGPSTTNYRTYGIPTVRTDRPTPRVKRLSDTTNYGEQATAADLLHSALHSLWGVHEEHFLCPRTKEEIAEIFRNVGVNISGEMLEAAWEEAALRHPAGEVCVDMFRHVLHEMKAN